MADVPLDLLDNALGFSGQHSAQSYTRTVAEQLAGRHTIEELAPLFEREGAETLHTEALACLLQEIVIRRPLSAENSPLPSSLREFRKQLASRGHPLAWLPLHTIPLEREINHALEGLQGFWHSAAELPPHPQLPPTSGGARDVAGGSLPLFRDITDSGTAMRIAVSVEAWRTESNGRIEACQKELSRVLLPEEMSSALLVSAGLACLQGCSAEEVFVVSVGPSEVWEELFVSAAYEGLLSKGHRGAYGRLHGWQSLAALAGYAPEESFEEIAARVQQCRFWAFATSSKEWFFQIYRDIGIAVLRPDGGSMAFLAATDTD